MLTKIEITGIIKVMTGMHIGGSSVFAAIGAVDSPVIRDAYSDDPMIPGSSVKGKMRYLLSRQYSGDKVFVDLKDEDIRVKRLFGYSADGSEDASDQRKKCMSRLQFPDMFLSNKSKLDAEGIETTEVKFENSINRITAEANPRQIERTVRGSEFAIHWIYNVEKEEEIVSDFETIAEGLRLLKYDYLGGHGSRGYGKVDFADLGVDCVTGEISDKILDECRKAITGA